MEAIVRRQLSGAVIHAVPVKPDVGHDGDDILRVRVVEDGNERLDPKEVADTSGSIWFGLDEAGIESFPIVSYMTKSNAASLRQFV